MYFRRSGEQERRAGMTRSQANRADLLALVEAGETPGLIGYRGKTPVGWVSLGPREDYAKLARSPVMKPVDAQPVWSVVCFVVPEQFRGEGVARALLDGAIAYAKKRGATLLEAYPVDKREPIERRRDVVRREVDVRRRRIRRGRTAQTASTDRADSNALIEGRPASRR